MHFLMILNEKNNRGQTAPFALYLYRWRRLQMERQLPNMLSCSKCWADGTAVSADGSFTVPPVDGSKRGQRQPERLKPEPAECNSCRCLCMSSTCQVFRCRGDDMPCFQAGASTFRYVSFQRCYNSVWFLFARPHLPLSNTPQKPLSASQPLSK